MGFSFSELNAFESLRAFYAQIDKFYELGDTYAKHKVTGVSFSLADCDGIAFLDVYELYMYHYNLLLNGYVLK